MVKNRCSKQSDYDSGNDGNSRDCPRASLTLGISGNAYRRTEMGQPACGVPLHLFQVFSVAAVGWHIIQIRTANFAQQSFINAIRPIETVFAYEVFMLGK